MRISIGSGVAVGRADADRLHVDATPHSDIGPHPVCGAVGPQTLAGGTPQTVDEYKMVPGAAPGTVYFLEDYPEGSEAHGMTLAVGVFRWVRFNAMLVDAEVQSFASVEERNAAGQQLGVEIM